jgi:hypothetical protein
MAISEPDRHHLYEAARRGAWDERAAGTLMSLLPPVGWADVATKQDLEALRRSLRGDITELRGELHREIGGLRSELHHEIGQLRSEIGALHAKTFSELGALRAETFSEFGALRAEVGAIRGDLLAQTRAMIVAMAGFFVATSAVVIAATRLGT